MKILMWPLRGGYKIYMLILFSTSLLAFYPFFYFLLKSRDKFPHAFRLKRLWAAVLQPLVGIYLSVEKRGQLPQGPYIICPNHTSYLDIILSYRLFKDYFVFMGKQEIAKWPLFNIFFKKNMNILVDRESRVGSHRALLRAGEEIDLGNSIVIFPEGGIPDDAPKLRKFKNGAFKLAIEKQIPIVPVTFITNWKLLQGTKLLKGKAGPGIARVVIHEAIGTKGMTEKDLINLRDRVYQTIGEPLQKTHTNAS